MGELMDMQEGFKYRDELAWEKIAQNASWFMATQMKNAPTAGELLGKKLDKKKTSPDETKGVLYDLTKRLGKGLVEGV
jgi:hypothetical protein